MKCMYCRKEFFTTVEDRKLCDICLPIVRKELIANPHKYTKLDFGNLLWHKEDDESKNYC